MGIVWVLRGIMNSIGDFVIGSFHKYPDIELVLAMVIFPIIFDVIVFWVTDNFLMFENSEENISKLNKCSHVSGSSNGNGYKFKSLQVNNHDKHDNHNDIRLIEHNDNDDENSNKSEKSLENNFQNQN
mmetsp:Transcript_6808/g.14555  ORF Transcript_6808/g.14555 Transcript_6808/m.14555 type:complete len:128 (+) Transcript_6808:507-890(+)